MHRRTPTREVIIKGVELNWDLPWDTAIFRSGEDSDPECFIFQVEDRYPSSRKGLEKVDVHLIGFDVRKKHKRKKSTWRKEVALDILEDKGMIPAHPRILFALGENWDQVLQKLDRHYVSLVSLVPCKVRVGENDVNMVSETWIADDCQESRLIPASYIFQRFRWVVGVPINA